MATAQQTYLRTELLRRHKRLESALQSPAADASLSSLLREVDAALSAHGRRHVRSLQNVP